MPGRERVRRCLGGQAADRPPLIAFASKFAARLERVDPPRLWQDAGALTRTLLGLEGLFALDAVVVEVPPDVLAERRLATVADGVARLRALLGERAALVLALPGPITGATSVGRGRAPETLEEFGAEILKAAKLLGPEHVDCLAVVERAAVNRDDAQPLEEALTPLWNAARYYAASSLLVLAEGTPEVAGTGAQALVVLRGASPHELVARGARCVGAPIASSFAATEVSTLPELPVGGFYTTDGELAADTEIDWLHHVVAAVGHVQ